MKIFLILFLIFIGVVFPIFLNLSFAVCPICAIAVSAGVGFSRYLGVDDLIVGFWIGGLIVSLIIWTENIFDKKKIFFKGRLFLNAFFYYFLILFSLFYGKFLTLDLANYRAFFFSKILWGIAIGSFGFWGGARWYNYLKEKNGGRANFPFQKVVMPILPLIFLSLLFYFLM